MSTTVKIDLVEHLPGVKAAVEVAEEILREPHDFKPKEVKAAAVFLAEIEATRYTTIEVATKAASRVVTEDGYGGIVE